MSQIQKSHQTQVTAPKIIEPLNQSIELLSHYDTDFPDSNAEGRENYSPNRHSPPSLSELVFESQKAQISLGGEPQLHDDFEPNKQRKCSMADIDEDMNNCEEIKCQEEKDVRQQVNQKLIKNKNQFMEYMAGRDLQQQTPHAIGMNYVKIKHQQYYQERQPQRQEYVMILDKRSRSETPNKMSATDVLFRAHKKLKMKRKESPSKLLEKHQQKQKKAEEVRTQIENSKKKWYEKIRNRQQIAKQKWKELLAERKRALYDKLEQAEERRESEIDILRNKAKQEIQKFEETNYIVKMIMNNMKLDMNIKMNETLERRNQILEENKRKHHDRHMKEEAAEKRRKDILKEHESKISKQRLKMEQAEFRRNQMLEQRKKASQEYQKRIKVLQRKHDLDKISDVMSFVNNSEQIWEFLGNENEWKDLGLSEQDDIIYELISKDQLEIQKYKLKRDAELLNKIIVTDEQGNIFARKEYLPLINRMNKRRRKNRLGFGESSSESSSEDDFEYQGSQNFISGSHIDQEEVKECLNQQQLEEEKEVRPLTPSRKIQQRYLTTEEIKANDCLSEASGDKDDSIADEESALKGENFSQEKNYKKCHMNSQEDSSLRHSQQQYFSDEAQNYQLYQIRIKMSMKRNILKKTLSEDLTWADFLKNESQYPGMGIGYPNIFGNQVRSMYSTPERKTDIPSEYEKEEDTQSNPLLNQSIVSGNQKTIIQSQANQSSKNKKKKNLSSGKNISTQNSFVGNNTSNVIQQNIVSEKSQRISSVVYPSSKKKNPKNEKQQLNTSTFTISSDQHIHTGSTLVGGLTNFKLNKGSVGGSNTSSTTSLLLIQQQNASTTEIQKDSLFTLVQGGRRSLILENDSGRKKQCHTARINTNGMNEVTSNSGIIPQNIFNTQLGNPNINTMISTMMELEDKTYFDSHNTGNQISQLLTNSKPLPTLSKVVPKKLTLNANKLLFPLAHQKLLLKRPGKDGLFGKLKINLKIEEVFMTKNQASTNLSQTMPLPQLAQSSINQTIEQTANNLKSIDFQQKIEESLGSGPVIEQEKAPGDEKSHVSTPVYQGRKDSTDTQNSQTLASVNEQNASGNTVSTPMAQQSKLLQIQQKFQEKLQSQTPTGSFIMEQSQNLLKKKNALADVQIPSQGGNVVGDRTPSPKKDSSQLKQPSKFANEDQQISEVTQLLHAPSILQFTSTITENQVRDLLVKYLLLDNINSLKLEDTQKTIFLEGDEASSLIDYLEQNEVQMRYCRLCELLIPEAQSNETHVSMKLHKKTRDDLQIKDYEDWQLSILSINSCPGDIEKELQKEKEKALKRKVKRIKAQMIAQAISHEAATSCPGKDFTSTNKKRCQILCIELEKQVIPIIKDYEALENSLKEIIKILDMRKQADLHLMRKLKFIPILIEICKRISVCHKSEFKHLGRVLEFVIKIINTLCGLRENRNYMLQTNRMSALIELLHWCLNRPTHLFYGITFVPQLFHILTLHVKHRAPYECQQMKELFVEYLISSQITMKIKSKFQIINGPLDLSEMMGQVPLFLLKSATFLESMAALVSRDAVSRPVYEKTEKIGEHAFFVIQNTELFGIPQMISTILLTMNQPFKPSQNTSTGQQKVLPQTILSLAITSIKIINNVYRMDYRFAQQIMSDFEIQEQLYHLFNYILVYTVETLDKQEDSKELLHETILFIGYFSLNNEKNQGLLCKGENTIIQKLCALPIAYFHDKKLKEILFPTLIQASYKNERCLAIMDQEISIDMLVNFISTNNKEELSKIIEEENDYQSMSSVSHSGAGGLVIDRRSHRSPSISSTNSSQCSLQIDMINGNSPFIPLVMRFPKKLWKDAIQFFSSVLY